MAYEDLFHIFDYISGELLSPQAAEQLINKIEKRVEAICQFPFSCPYVQDTFLKEQGYRKAIVNNFILYYFVEENLVIIERILYDRRDYINGL